MKVVLLNSGGKDCLAAAILTYGEHELHSLYVDAGNPSSAAERVVAEKIAAKYAASHKVISLSGGPYEAEGRFGYAVMPYKAAVLHTLAAMYAACIGAEGIVTGQRDDILVEDWDVRLFGVLSMSHQRGPVRLLPPLQGTGKTSERIYQVVKDEPLWKETVVCLKHPACGGCVRCRTRSEWLAREAAPPVVSLGGSAGGSGGAR